MDSHLERRAKVLDSVKDVLLRSLDVDESLVEKVLIHRELLSNRDIILNKDFYSVLRDKVRSMGEMVEICRRKEQVECVQISKRLVCPISQKEVVDPYVGSCGHVVERREAVRYLRNDPRAICPHVGCNKMFRESRRR